MRIRALFPACIACLALIAVAPVLADTEIRNFRLPLAPDLQALDAHPHPESAVAVQRLSLSSADRQLGLTFTESSPVVEVALTFDVGEAYQYSAWTIRLSWPGSSPTAFTLYLAPSLTHTKHDAPSRRSAALLISASPLSPRLPPPPPQPWPPYVSLNSLLYALAYPLRPVPSSSAHHDDNNAIADAAGAGLNQWSTPAHLVLEPLILGAIPRTALPAIALILLFGTGAALVVPRILLLIEAILSQPSTTAGLPEPDPRSKQQ